MAHRKVALYSAAICSITFIGIGCSTAARTTTPERVSNCGVPYSFKVNTATVTSGSCAGQLGLQAPEVTVRAGTSFSVETVHETNGTLDYPIPTPTNASVALVDQTGSTATYAAKSPGNVDLQARGTPYCSATNPALGTCVVLVVHVT